MLFTDENGDKYEEARGEAIPFDNKGMIMPEGVTLIRLKKEEPKWEVKSVEQDYQGYWVAVKFGDVTKDQANLIKEAIEALMAAITSRYELDSPILLPNGKQRVEMAIAIARSALQKDKI